MRTQARGLARAVAGEVVEKVVDVAWPWRWFQAGWPGVLNGAKPREGGPLEAPWPDVVVSCGRRSGILGLAVKRAAGGRPVLAHVQDPLTDPARFDLVVAMEHDRARGPNVLRVLTAVHDLTPQRLADGAAAWSPRFAGMARPLIGVLLGGPTRGSEFGAGEAHLLLERLAAYRAALGGSLLIVPSRRTPDGALSVFRRAADESTWVWDRAGENPYVGVLALADRLVVTGDSVSMVSEALATRAQVEVFASGLRKRHAGFVQDLVDHGLVRLFDGQATDAAPRPIVDATREAAARLKALLSK